MNRGKTYGVWLTALAMSLAIAVTLTGQVGQDRDGRGLSAAAVPASPGNPDVKAFASPSDFGTSDEAVRTIQGFAFQPRASATTFDGDVVTGRWVTGGPDVLYAPMPEVPNGATLTQVVFYIQDTDATADFEGRLCRHYLDSSTGANPEFDCLVDITSTGNTTASGFIFQDVAQPINYRFDADGDLDIDVVSYTLSAFWGTSTNGSIKLRQARILYRRNVSPAPGFATFADVPVGDPIHRFVEALAAAGITGGCGGGNYCPNQAVTRGQMAVFISAALGLHWPAF